MTYPIRHLHDELLDMSDGMDVEVRSRKSMSELSLIGDMTDIDFLLGEVGVREDDTLIVDSHEFTLLRHVAGYYVQEV